MSSPGDNMAQTEPLTEEDKRWIAYVDAKCKNCTHPHGAHFGRTGCNATDDGQTCHCTNFEVKE